MSKIKINIPAFEYFFKLIGINTPLKAYRVSYIINSALDIDLVKTDDIKIDIRKKKEKHSFELLKDEKSEVKYFLFNNKTIGKELFRTYKGFDFVLLVKFHKEINFVDDIVKKLKEPKKFKIVLNSSNIKKIDENYIKKEFLYKNIEKKVDIKLKTKNTHENSKQ